jgi:hypothetical protein
MNAGEEEVEVYTKAPKLINTNTTLNRKRKNYGPCDGARHEETQHIIKSSLMTNASRKDAESNHIVYTSSSSSGSSGGSKPSSSKATSGI